MAEVIQFKKGMGIGKYIAIGVVLVIILAKSVTVIPAGYVGILELFGKVRGGSLPAGIHLINPLYKVTKMSIRTQELTEDAVVPSKEGLTVSLDVTLLFSLEPQKAPEVYKTVGPNYLRVVVEPQFRSVIRGATASYEAKALYTSEREVIAHQMMDDLTPLLEARGIRVEKILLRKVTLPKILSDAIEVKLEHEQKAEQMKFVLDREKQEAERKRVEAQGIADFQKTVAEGLTEAYLKWKGIEATQKLSESGNSKVVIIGSGKEGLPVILGGQ